MHRLGQPHTFLAAARSHTSRRVWSFWQRSPEKDWRFPCKLPKRAPISPHASREPYGAFGVFRAALQQRLAFSIQALQRWPRKLQTHRMSPATAHDGLGHAAQRQDAGTGGRGCHRDPRTHTITRHAPQGKRSDWCVTRRSTCAVERVLPQHPALVLHGRFAHCPGRKPPFWAGKRPARPYKSGVQNRFTVGNAKAA